MSLQNKRHIEATNHMDLYLELAELTEPPLLFHRWSFISSVAACLGRSVHLPFGEWKIYPNFYVTLIGPPGARKGVAINLASSLLQESGYEHFSGDRSSKEKFMADWEFGFDKINQGIEPEDARKKGSSIIDEVDSVLTDSGRDSSRICEVYIKAGELEDFLGSGNSNFISTLTNLWDNLPYYSDRFKNSKSLYIPNPTVNMLGGATPTTFASIFSTTIIGQGMLSRMLLIYGKGQRLRLTIPPPPPAEIRAIIVELFRDIRHTVKGEMRLGEGSYEALDYIYNNPIEIPDARFASYSSRRFTHLLKLCIVIAASELRTTITVEDVTMANTVLSYTELNMPAALGEFGKAKNAEVTQSVLEAIRGEESKGGITIIELHKRVSQDISTLAELGDIVAKLVVVDKVKSVKRPNDPNTAWLIPAETRTVEDSKYVNFDLLWEHKLNSF